MIFSYDSYKKYLIDKIAENKNIRNYKTLLAKAASCQPSFLSHVLHTEVHLTPDHACGLAEFWRMAPLEFEYFLLLVNIERAASLTYRNYLLKRKKEIKEQNENLSKRIKSKQIENKEIQSIYYSSWIWAALHFIVTIPQYQTPKAIALRLHLPIEVVMDHLQQLKTMGLLAEEKGIWKTRQIEIHLPKDSFMTSMNHSHWRQRAVQDSQNKTSDSVHYSAVYTLSQVDYERLKELAVKFIEDNANIVRKSSEEEISVFTLDLFRM